MKTVLLPVKDFSDAKHRLTSALAPQARAGLAKAMLSDVLDALSSAEADRVVVYTGSENVIRIERPFGFDVVRESHVGGHSAAVNHMLPILASTSERVLVIAADLPWLTSEEVSEVFQADCDSVAILPSRDGTGTNGMLFIPPAQIEMEYGEGSFIRHMHRATTTGLTARVLRIPGVAFDIDTPDDLATFLHEPRIDSETWRFLRLAHSAAR